MKPEVKALLARIYGRCRDVEGCQEWQGCMTSDKLPTIKLPKWARDTLIPGRSLLTVSLPALVYTLQTDTPFMRPNRRVWRTCRNPRCLKLDHLQWGSEAAYGRFRSESGSAAIGAARRARLTKVRRERSKLDMQTAQAIRFEAEAISREELAKKYGVTRTTIGHILTGKTWVDTAVANSSVFNWRPAA